MAIRAPSELINAQNLKSVALLIMMYNRPLWVQELLSELIKAKEVEVEVKRSDDDVSAVVMFSFS